MAKTETPQERHDRVQAENVADFEKQAERPALSERDSEKREAAKRGESSAKELREAGAHLGDVLDRQWPARNRKSKKED